MDDPFSLPETVANDRKALEALREKANAQMELCISRGERRDAEIYQVVVIEIEAEIEQLKNPL